MIGFARLYVRVHSWNQIMFGWQLGLWLAFYFHFCLRDSVINHIEALVSSKRFLSHERKRHILIATLIFTVAVIALVGTYIASIYLSEPDPTWAPMIQSKCPTKIPGKSKFFADESIMTSSLSILPFTAYLGLHLHRVKYGAVWPDMLRSTGFFPALGRFMIQIILPLPFLTPLFLVPWGTFHVAI